MSTWQGKRQFSEHVLRAGHCSRQGESAVEKTGQIESSENKIVSDVDRTIGQ